MCKLGINFWDYISMIIKHHLHYSEWNTWTTINWKINCTVSHEVHVQNNFSTSSTDTPTKTLPITQLLWNAGSSTRFNQYSKMIIPSKPQCDTIKIEYHDQSERSNHAELNSWQPHPATRWQRDWQKLEWRVMWSWIPYSQFLGQNVIHISYV